MLELSNAEAALLGLLSEKPMHPYQIEQEVKYRDMRFWTELSMSSIYKLLRKLEKEGMVLRTNKISSENRLRKLYEISKEGKETLKEKIKTLLSAVEHTRWQVDIGAYNCSLLTEEEVQASLKKYKISIQEKIKEYQELQFFLKSINCPPHRLALALRPVYLLEAEFQWVNSFLEQLAEERRERI